MKNSCLKVNNNKSWHWQPEDRAFGNVLGLVKSEDWSNLVTLLRLLWYYSPNLTCPNSQGMFLWLSKMLQLSNLAEATLLLECNSVCLTVMPTPLRKLKTFMYVSPAIQESACVLCFHRTEVQAESHSLILQTFALSSWDILNILDYLVHKILIFELFHEWDYFIWGCPTIGITKNSTSTCHQGQNPFQWKVSFMFRSKGSSGTEDSHKPPPSTWCAHFKLMLKPTCIEIYMFTIHLKTSPV